MSIALGCQNRFLRWTPTQVEISAKGCWRQVEEMWRCWGLGFSVCAAPLQYQYLHPLILEDLRTEWRRSDKGQSCQRAEETEENRGEFAGSIQDDIRTERQSPQRAEYLYFTLDMYSNREAEERHSRDIAKSLQMTNRWVTYMERRSVISVTDQKVNGTQLWVIRSNLKREQGKQEQKRNGSIQ